MSRTFIASVALALAVPALAAPALAQPASETPASQPVSFSHDGVNYVYTVTYKADGRRVIQGTADGAPFRLIAGKSRVRGTVENRPVEFDLAEVKALTVRERLATR